MIEELKPLKINPPLNVTYVTDDTGLELVSKFLDRSDKVIGWDKETTPVKDFYNRRDRLWQIGDKNEQFVVDLLYFADSDPTKLSSWQGDYGAKVVGRLARVRDVFSRALCSGEFLKVGVNLAFEYEQSYWCFGQRTWNFFSCDIVERVIQAGAHSLKDYDYYSLEQLVARYFKMKVDKELQTSFNLTDPLTAEQIEYAALDTWLPLAIRKKQLEIIKRDGLELVSTIENNAIGSFVDMHVHGLRMDEAKWNAKADANAAELLTLVKTELDPVFLPIVGSKLTVVTDKQVEKAKETWKVHQVPTEREKNYKKEARGLKKKDPAKHELLMQNVARLEAERKATKDKLKKVASELGKTRTKQRNLAEKCEGDALINYASNAQVYDVLVTLPGLKELKGTEDGEMDEFKDHPVIKSFRKYRELSKKVKTYGKTWTTKWTTKPCKEEGWLHPGDGRLHSKFNQLEAETGRSSSSQPNGQNIPHDGDTRSCFIADPPDADEPEGYVIMTADMAGAELRIMAEEANEPVWIEAFNRGEDVHEVCAEKMYPADWPIWAKPGCPYYALKPDGTPAHEKCGKCKAHKKEKDKKVINACPNCCMIHAEYRDNSKIPNFLIPYGGGAPNLASVTGKSIKECEEIFEKHAATFPTLHAYLDESGKRARAEMESRDMFGRRRIFLEPTWDNAIKQILEDAKEEDSMWEKKMRVPPSALGYKGFKWTPAQWERAVEQVIADYVATNGKKPTKDVLYTLTHKEKPTARDISFCMEMMDGRIERQGKNHRIQGANASIAKLAMGCGFDSNGKPFLWHILPQFKAKLLAFVHDELLIQCPKRFGEAVAKAVGDAFKRAAAEKMKKVVMEFDYKLMPYWCK